VYGGEELQVLLISDWAMNFCTDYFKAEESVALLDNYEATKAVLETGQSLDDELLLDGPLGSLLSISG